MMIAAVNAHHRGHRLPLSRQPLDRQVILRFPGGPWLRHFKQLNGCFHSSSFPQTKPAILDSSQKYLIHFAAEKTRLIDLSQIILAAGGANYRCNRERMVTNDNTNALSKKPDADPFIPAKEMA